MGYLFSYGTLRKENVQLELFGRVLKGWNDTLPGYKAIPVEIKDVSFLSKGEQVIQQTAIYTGHPQDRIEGKIFEVTEDELMASDKYEPDGYKRIIVNSVSGKKVWLYVADQ